MNLRMELVIDVREEGKIKENKKLVNVFTFVSKNYSGSTNKMVNIRLPS